MLQAKGRTLTYEQLIILLYYQAGFLLLTFRKLLSLLWLPGKNFAPPLPSLLSRTRTWA